MSYTVPYGGERLDRIARTLLQTERRGAVEALLAANPDLAARHVSGLVPAGTVINLPTAYAPAKATGFVLAWE